MQSYRATFEVKRATLIDTELFLYGFCNQTTSIPYDPTPASRPYVFYMIGAPQVALEYFGGLSSGHDLSRMGLRYEADHFCSCWNKQWKHLWPCSCSGEDIDTRLHFTLFSASRKVIQERWQRTATSTHRDPFSYLPSFSISNGERIDDNKESEKEKKRNDKVNTCSNTREWINHTFHLLFQCHKTARV